MELELIKKVKDFRKKCVKKVKDDPLGTILLVGTFGLSAYSAYTTVKRGDELRLIDDPDDDSEEPDSDNSDENG